jgi:hypothetical protein
MSIHDPDDPTRQGEIPAHEAAALDDEARDGDATVAPPIERDAPSRKGDPVLYDET